MDTHAATILYYNLIYCDMLNLLNALYIEIGGEANISTTQERSRNNVTEKIHDDNVYAF